MDRHFKVALFDLDGVVFDTEGQYTQFWFQQCKHYHPDKPGLENLVKGQTLVQIYDRYFSGMKKEQEQITRELNSFELNMDFPYIKGFVKFFNDLKSNGIKTAIITSSNRQKMLALYEKRPEFKAMFDAILTSEDFLKSKPDPDCYLEGARRLGEEIESCIVFEDSFNGLKAGRAAGMKVIGLATTNSIEEITPLADYVTQDFLNLDYKRVCDLFL